MELRELLIRNVSRLYTSATFFLNFQNLIGQIRPNAWAAIVPVSPGVTKDNIVNVVVDRALMEGWIRPIVDELETYRNPGNASELDAIQRLLEEHQPRPTVVDPFQEVLLDGNRPFANRVDLRLSLRSMCHAQGAPVLVVSGEPKSGKTYSFYLTQHIARQHDFMTSQFEVSPSISAEILAKEVMRRVGVPLERMGSGLESEQRSGKELADRVKDSIEERGKKRMFVFDGFPLPNETPLSPETVSFIVRLVKYADEELRPLLRIVLIRFSDTLPDAIDDVAERDQAQPFTDADMFAVLRQVATARGWSVSDQALNAEIAQVSGKSLRERFTLMRNMIRRLSQSPPPAGAIVEPVAPPSLTGQS